MDTQAYATAKQTLIEYAKSALIPALEKMIAYKEQQGRLYKKLMKIGEDLDRVHQSHDTLIDRSTRQALLEERELREERMYEEEHDGEEHDATSALEEERDAA